MLAYGAWHQQGGPVAKRKRPTPVPPPHPPPSFVAGEQAATQDFLSSIQDASRAHCCEIDVMKLLMFTERLSRW